MPTDFDFSFTFEADSIDAVIAAYFNEDHLAAQDVVANLVERTITETREDDESKQTTWRVRSSRQLPVYVRPLVEGGHLSFLEMQKWRKRDNEIDMTVTPQILGGKAVQIAGVYKLSAAGPGRVHRRYAGKITAGVPLLAGKIERGILEEFTKGVPLMADVTQKWLKR